MPPKKKAKREDHDEPVPSPDKDQTEDDEDFKPARKRPRGKSTKADSEAKGTKRPRDNSKDTDITPSKLVKTDDDIELETVEEVKGGRAKAKRKPKEAFTKKSSTEGGASGSTSSNGNTTSVSDLDFTLTAVNKGGSPWTLKFSSWNVNGIRAWLKNNGLEYVKKEQPDIFCLQETKCDESDLPHDQLKIEGYKSYWSSAEQKGYSGTGLYCKKEPLKVTYGIGVEEHDKEGRVITAEFDRFYFVTTYIPNAGEKLKRLSYRTTSWDPAFRKYLKALDEIKPVIICGDLNVAHHEIDLANPKTNLKTSGFTVEERENFSTLLEENELVDSFRHLYPSKTAAYSYWSYRSNARKNNKGWRLDYFLVSKRIIDRVCDHVIRSEVKGSDHCPIVLLMTEIE